MHTLLLFLALPRCFCGLQPTQRPPWPRTQDSECLTLSCSVYSYDSYGSVNIHSLSDEQDVGEGAVTTKRDEADKECHMHYIKNQNSSSPE